MNKNAAVSCYPGFFPYPSHRAKQMQKSRCNVDDVSNTQRFNSYTYANNNPMRFTDPTGYDGFDDVYLGPGMQAWNGIKPEQDGPGGGSGGFNSPINFWVKLSEVTITAYSPVWDNWKNWYRENNDPYLIWGKNAGANAGGMFGSISVSDTRRYWQNMSMKGGGFGGGGVDPVSGGIFAAGVQVSMIEERLGTVYSSFNAMQAESKALNLGLDYTNELAKVGNAIKFARFAGYAFGVAGVSYDYYNTFLSDNPTMSKGKFYLNATMTVIGFIGIPGAIISGVYFGVDTFVPGGWETVSKNQYNLYMLHVKDGVNMAPWVTGGK